MCSSDLSLAAVQDYGGLPRGGTYTPWLGGPGIPTSGGFDPRTGRSVCFSTTTDIPTAAPAAATTTLASTDAPTDKPPVTKIPTTRTPDTPCPRISDICTGKATCRTGCPCPMCTHAHTKPWYLATTTDEPTAAPTDTPTPTDTPSKQVGGAEEVRCPARCRTYHNGCAACACSESGTITKCGRDGAPTVCTNPKKAPKCRNYYEAASTKPTDTPANEPTDTPENEPTDTPANEPTRPRQVPMAHGIIFCIIGQQHLGFPYRISFV